MICNFSLLSMLAYAATEPVSAPYQRGGNGIWEMIGHAGPMVKFVLVALLALSIACWCVILLKTRLVRRAKKESHTSRQ